MVEFSLQRKEWHSQKGCQGIRPLKLSVDGGGTLEQNREIRTGDHAVQKRKIRDEEIVLLNTA